MDKQWLLDADEQAAWRRFVDMHHLLERHLALNLQREFGLSAPDFEILVNLSEAPEGRMRAYALSRATSWEKSRLSHHLGRMEKRGLVSREEDPHGDSRFPQVVLTEAGRAAIRSAAPANAARVRQLFIDVLGPDRLAVFRQASEDVIAAIQEHRSDRNEQ
ncbi:MarR family winged helix-turn-helix transcriptional regulator [Mycobacterium sp. 1423905.2]|uniref:MarR family winged helix-turn-helix transcriptional regulator n=1 Tax=Mycobacterium sp. 1423905.2 TaxID=1856859 RepID=UPI0007FE6602|nr:MarR family transcriptional regulator [Mycobacterium sp. 1423905.2]OBJ50891.1 MarR family transcriptional regulator [Mycobacterium sp. 1423905.2]